MTQTFLEYLNELQLSSGLGTAANPCSIAAYNLYTTGELTDEIPDCMSLVVGKFIIRIQDAMPDQLRNSQNWKVALANAPGTGRDKEKEGIDLILHWMWTVVLPQVNAVAQKGGYENEWQHMLKERSSIAAAAAADASRTARASRAAAAVADDDAARTAAADAALAVTYAARASRIADAAAADAADDVAAVAALAAFAVTYAARASRTARADDDAAEAFWTKVDPAGLLERINAVQ